MAAKPAWMCATCETTVRTYVPPAETSRVLAEFEAACPSITTTNDPTIVSSFLIDFLISTGHIRDVQPLPRPPVVSLYLPAKTTERLMLKGKRTRTKNKEEEKKPYDMNEAILAAIHAMPKPEKPYSSEALAKLLVPIVSGSKAPFAFNTVAERIRNLPEFKDGRLADYVAPRGRKPKVEDVTKKEEESDDDSDDGGSGSK